MDLVLHQMVQLEDGHHTHSHRLVVGNAGLAVPQGLLAKGRYGMPRGGHDFLSHLMDTGFCDTAYMTFTLHPQAQTGADGSQIVLGTVVRVQIFWMEDRFRIVLTIAQPFGSCCK